jgi:protease-4
VLRINSPGGTVTASDIVYNEILEFKKKAKKPVVACLMDVAASGGYYVACAADRIVAHPTGVTGSIGVMMELISIEGLFQKIGVSAMAIKSGDKKDMGSPFRQLSAEEKAIFQATIDSMYNRFVDVVVEGRPKLSRDQIKKLADGRIYTAPDAEKNGLVDKVGQLSEAIELAKQAADVTKAHVIMYTRPMATGQSGNIYTTKTPNGTTNINLINVNFDEFRKRTGPVFMYLWAPGT